jgi:hypothetical protein
VDYSVAVAGTFRAVYVSRALTDGVDMSWLSYNALAAGIAESNLAVICACAPSLKSLLSNFFRDQFTKSGNSERRYGSSGHSGNRNFGRSEKGQNDIILTERSVEVKIEHRDSSEPSPSFNGNPGFGSEEVFSKSFMGPTPRTTEISRCGVGDDPSRSENRLGSSDGRSFYFFADTDEEEIGLTHSLR